MRIRTCWVVPAAVFCLVLQIHSQQPAAPALKQVLSAVRQHYDAYLRTVPNLYAQERLTSSLTFPRASMDTSGGFADGQRITYDSVLRLKQTGVEGAAPKRLEETRQVISVDRQPATPEQVVQAPALVSGAFSYALDVLSAGVAPCYMYKLQPVRRWQGKAVVVVEYRSITPAFDADAGCRNSEPNSGRVLIDPESMQIVRLEQTRPKHTMSAQTAALLSLPPETIGIWAWSIDYAPVTLEERSFQLPRTVTSTFEIQAARHVLWSSQSSYSRYQLTDVHSKILLPGGAVAPQP